MGRGQQPAQGDGAAGGDHRQRPSVRPAPGRCRMTSEETRQAIDEARRRAESNGQADKPKADEKQRESASTRVVKLALAAGVELFHDEEQAAYADIEIDGVRQTWPVSSRPFKDWLTRLYYLDRSKAVTAQATLEAAGVLS